MNDSGVTDLAAVGKKCVRGGHWTGAVNGLPLYRPVGAKPQQGCARQGQTEQQLPAAEAGKTFKVVEVVTPAQPLCGPIFSHWWTVSHRAMPSRREFRRAESGRMTEEHARAARHKGSGACATGGRVRAFPRRCFPGRPPRATPLQVRARATPRTWPWSGGY